MKLKIFNLINWLIIPGFKSSMTIANYTNVTQLREIIPDLLQGYLFENEIPNSLKLLPPPPEHTSEAFAFDLEQAKKAMESRDINRRLQAINDANLTFPAAIKSFESVLSVEISQERTPILYRLIRKVMTDAGLSTYAAKNHYNRVRPFVFHNTKCHTPDQEEKLRKIGSFPSGHSAVGWAWALVLSEVFPNKKDVILERGYDFGESRIFCHAHWHSDVEMGRVMGKATVESLRANAAFQKDFMAAKDEAFLMEL
jgi:acid phosphatase (class A)